MVEYPIINPWIIKYSYSLLHMQMPVKDEKCVPTKFSTYNKHAEIQ